MAYREIGMWEILDVLRRVARGERQRERPDAPLGEIILKLEDVPQRHRGAVRPVYSSGPCLGQRRAHAKPIAGPDQRTHENDVDLDLRAGRGAGLLAQADPLPPAAALGRVARPRVIDEQASHRVRGDGEKVRTVAEVEIGTLHEVKPGLVDQRGRTGRDTATWPDAPHAGHTHVRPHHPCR